MNINKSNIDEVLFDYFEGNLSLHDKMQVDKFISENPSFQQDFKAWESSFVEDDHLQFKNVDALLANEDSGKSPWFKWGFSSLLLILLSFLSYAVYFEFSGKKEKSAANNDQNNNNSNNSGSNSSSKGMLIKDDAPTVNTIVNKESAKMAISETKVATKSNENSNESSGKQQNNFSRGSSKSFDKVSNSSAASQLNTGWNKNSSIDFTNVAPMEELDNSKLANIDVQTKGWSVFNQTIAKAVSANIKSKKVDEMNSKPGTIELVNLNDPFVLYGGVAPIQENPSFAGNTDGIRIKTMSRYEWPELKTASFITNAISVDGYSNKVKGGLGLVLHSDIMGGNKYSATGMSLVYAPKFKLSNNISIEPSIKYELSNRIINWENVGTGDFIDPRTGTLLASSAILPEGVKPSSFLVHSFGAGLLINTKVIYAGFAVDNLFSPSYKNNLFDQTIVVPLKFTAQLGTDIRKNERSPWVYSPSVSIRNQGLYNKVWMSNVVRYKNVLAGAHFSTADAMMFTAGYTNSNFRITYSYGLSTVPFNTDYNSSSMIGSHQLTMRYVIKKAQD